LQGELRGREPLEEVQEALSNGHRRALQAE
jgi:hypothetical protein